MLLPSPCPAPAPTPLDPKNLKPYPFHGSEGGQLDRVASQVAVGRGHAVCSSRSSARCEIHISWRCPRGLFPSVLVLGGEKASKNWRGRCGGGGQEGPTAKACSALGTAALEAPPLPSSSQITRFVARLLMMQLSSSGEHLF